MLKKILFVVLIVVALFAISQTGLFPKLKLNIFKKEEVKIADTPLDITDIKDIGELITAEFCGEVYADLIETYGSILQEYNDYVAIKGDTLGEYRDSLIKMYPSFEKILKQNVSIDKHNSEIESLDKEYEKLKSSFYLKKKENEEREKTFNEAIAKNKEDNDTYDQTKKELNEKLNSIRIIEKENKKTLRQLKWKAKKNKAEIEKLQSTLNNINENIDGMLERLNNNKKVWEKNQRGYGTLKKIYEKEKKDYDRENKSFTRKSSNIEKDIAGVKKKIKDAIDIKKNIVYIGRGWVKAGYKLNSIETEDIKITTRNDSTLLTLYIDSAQIIALDINPYYIQTKDVEIPGYELFMKKGRKGSFSNEEQTRVKIQCKQNLLSEALKKGLMERATESGVATLKQFFMLLNFDDVEIKFKSPSTEIDLNLTSTD